MSHIDEQESASAPATRGYLGLGLMMKKKKIVYEGRCDQLGCPWGASVSIWRLCARFEFRCEKVKNEIPSCELSIGGTGKILAKMSPSVIDFKDHGQNPLIKGDLGQVWGRNTIRIGYSKQLFAGGRGESSNP